MMLLSFINNISLLLALSICHSFVLHRWKPNSTPYRIASGVLFGSITIAGMMNPFVLTEGVIFDGRSFIASIAGLMGGPITAALVVVIGGAYRIWGIGGGGTIMGVCVLATSAVLGVIYRMWIRDDQKLFHPLFLYCFGVFVHLCMLMWMKALPSSQIWYAFTHIAPPVMIIFPVCTVVLGKMLQKQIRMASLFDALQEREEKYRELVENANSIILRLDREEKITFFNEYAQRFFGYSEKEIIGRSAVGTIIPEKESDGRNLQNIVQQITENPVKYSLHENENLRKNGERVWVSWTNRVVMDENNKPVEILCIGADITDRKKMETALRDSERHYKLLADNVTDVIWTADLNLRYTYLSPSIQQLLGFTIEEHLAKSVAEMVAPASYDLSMKVLAEELAIEETENPDTHRSRTLEIEQYRKDGSTVWTEVKVIFLRDENGLANGILGITRDISKRKKSEDALIQVTQRMSLAADSAGIGFWELDLVRNQLIWDDWMYRIYGIDPDHFNGDYETWKNTVHPDDLERAYNEIELAIQEKKHFNTEYRIIRADGEVRYIKANAVVVYDCDARPTRMTGINYDITEQKQAEEALRESNDRYQAIFERGPDGIVTLDPETARIIDFNDQACQQLGYSREEFGRLCVPDIEALETAEETSARIHKIIREGYDDFETQQRTKQGEIRDVHVTTQVIETGRRKVYHCVWRDITEQKQAENALRESEKEYRLLFENMQVGIVIHAPDTRVMVCNQMACEMLALSFDQMLRKMAIDPQWHFLCEDGSVMPLDAYPVNLVVSKREKMKNYVLGIVTPIRDYVTWLLVNAYPVVKSKGELHHIVVSFVDITERKQAEMALRESEERFRSLFEHSPLGYQSLDANGDFIELNETWCNLLGYSKEEVLGKNFSEFLHPDFREVFKENFPKFKSVGYILGIEFEMIKKDGSEIIVAFNGKIGHNDDGSFKQTHCVLSDITKRKQSEEALQNSEIKFRSLFEQAGDYILLMEFTENKGFVIIDANQVACTLHGYSREEFLGKSISDLDKNLDEKQMRDFLDRMMSGESIRFETVHERKDRTAFPVEVSAKILDFGEGPPLIMSIERDITERKKSDEKIKQQQYYLSKAQEIGQIGSWDMDVLQNRLTWTDENYKIFGIPQGTELTYETFLQCVHPDDRKYVDTKWKSSFNQEPYDIEHRLLVNGKTKWVREKAELEFDEHGNFLRGIGFTQDITERKQAEEEKERLQAQLLQTQKMEALGTLAGGIAHDFNNILAGIIGFTELTDKLIDSKEEEIHENLEIVLSSAHRAKNLVKQILAFSHKKDLEKTTFQPSLLVKECLKLLRSTLPSTIQIEQQIDTTSQNILGDPSQIHQVIMNLATNAAHAMRESGGILGVTLTEENVDASTPLLPFFEAVSGRYLCLQVRDTGHGIYPDIWDKVFDPFFTTKDRTGGTGLGLSVVMGIVKSHKGVMAMDSQVSQGTTFKIYLPIVDEPIINAEELEESPKGQGERILLVDDEEVLIKVGTRMLKSLGYGVIPCLGSTKALETFFADPGGFDLILTDQTMPLMKGTQLAQEIRKIRSDIPIILTTGYDERLQNEQLKEAGICDLLMKPYTSQELAHVITKHCKKSIDSGS